MCISVSIPVAAVIVIHCPSKLAIDVDLVFVGRACQVLYCRLPEEGRQLCVEVADTVSRHRLHCLPEHGLVEPVDAVCLSVDDLARARVWSQDIPLDVSVRSVTVGTIGTELSFPDGDLCFCLLKKV